jgi:hypothetical protein
VIDPAATTSVVQSAKVKSQLSSVTQTTARTIAPERRDALVRRCVNLSVETIICSLI